MLCRHRTGVCPAFYRAVSADRRTAFPATADGAWSRCIRHLAPVSAARLSGGEQRRLEVARSLALEPRFLLFDEPFAGVDPLVVESLHGILLDLRSRGIGILLTDHNVREALSLCDRAYVLFDGKVLAAGTSNDLIASEAVRRHFLGEAFAGA